MILLPEIIQMSSIGKGVLPAITTKLTSDDRLDLPLTKKNLEAQMAAGIDGIILGGTLGESSVLTNAERETMVKFSLDTIGGRIPVILNIAEGSTRDAIALAKDAQQWGVQGLMLLPPMRYKSDHRETVAFFKAIAAATPLPIMIYNNPVDYKTEVTLDMFDELVECSNIQAIKESTRDISNITRLKTVLAIACGCCAAWIPLPWKRC